MPFTREFFIQASLGVNGPEAEHFGTTNTFTAMTSYTTEFLNF